MVYGLLIDCAMNTPILLIHFNRPESTRRQIEMLQKIAPQRVWVLCDGPRPHRQEDVEKVTAVRAMLNDLPWLCEVKHLYRESNMGCFQNVSEGISWFLDDCGAGIILEDDVMPDSSFFRFCDELLIRYADASEVFAIAGHNRKPTSFGMETDYGFSNYFECWGWATWKRAWDQFDPTLDAWRDRWSWNLICKRVFRNYRARAYWSWMFRQVDLKRRDSWAYRFILTIWQRSGCVIIPKLNLTENIGFNKSGEHTAHFSGLEVSAAKQRFPLHHPPMIAVNPEVDRWFEDGVHSKSLLVRLVWLSRKLKEIYYH